MAKPAKSKPSRTRRPMPHVALLRGINVGGKNLLPKAALVDVFTKTGCGNVKTYIQSGNVVFTATQACAKRIPNLVSRRIHERFGFGPQVVIRTADELRGVAANNPFVQSGADRVSLYVAFLADTPDRRRVDALDPDRSPGDSFRVVGREIYLCLAIGAAKTKLSNSYFDGALESTCTVRNWRTVLKLVEMVDAMV